MITIPRNDGHTKRPKRKRNIGHRMHRLGRVARRSKAGRRNAR